MKIISSLLFSLLLSGMSSAMADVLARGQAGAQPWVLETVAKSDGVIWAMAFINENQLLITQLDGTVRLLERDTGKLTDISGAAEVIAEGQGGLLDIAIGPDYAEDGWIYFTYSKPLGEMATTALARARLQGTALSEWKDLLITQAETNQALHFGSRITFDGAGHLFFGVGDRGKREMSQDLSNHAGSILRLKLDGSVPADNPFVGKAGALAEIWSYGHRNPQGLFFDQATQRLWEIEHGPRGGDEINLIKAGANYGWPEVSHGMEYWGPIAAGKATERADITAPIKVYTPSIAPASLLVYSGEAFPAWRGDLFAGALKLRHLNRVSLNEKAEAVAEERLLADLGERIRGVNESPEGWLYLSTDSGKILRIRPQN